MISIAIFPLFAVFFQISKKDFKKKLDIFFVMGYNKDREALANSQRPPMVEITAL